MYENHSGQMKHEKMPGSTGRAKALGKADTAKMYKAVMDTVQRSKQSAGVRKASSVGKGGNPYGMAASRPASEKSAAALAAMARQRRG